MTTQGIIVIDVLGLGLIILLIQLLRKQRLNAGYALIWLFAVSSVMVIISIPPLLELVTRAVGAIFPVSALSLIAFVFIFLVLVYLSIQLSMLSAQQVELIQTLALKELLNQEEKSERAQGN